MELLRVGFTKFKGLVNKLWLNKIKKHGSFEMFIVLTFVISFVNHVFKAIDGFDALHGFMMGIFLFIFVNSLIISSIKENLKEIDYICKYYSIAVALIVLLAFIAKSLSLIKLWFILFNYLLIFKLTKTKKIDWGFYFLKECLK